MAEYQIADFIIDLSEIPSSDLLVQAGDRLKEVLVLTEPLTDRHTFPLDAIWNQLLKTARQNKRELDLDSLCLVQDQIRWEYKGKEVISPLFLVPLEWKINKAKQQVELTPDWEHRLLNPFVKNRFIRDFELKPAEDRDEFIDWVRDCGVPLELETWNGIGNFHHHRYSILRELELIMQSGKSSSLLATILGNESAESDFELELSPGLLTPADADQLSVFDQIRAENTVLQGPPGTGKSQVLVNLIGKRLSSKGMTLVVSEKRVALEVLVKKLGEAGLDCFAFLAHGGSDSRDFVRQLEKAWLKLEAPMEPPPALLFISDQQKAGLQLLLDKLNSPEIMSGLPFDQFREWLSGLTDPKRFVSSVPSAAEWLAMRPAIEAIEKDLGDLSIIRSLRRAVFLHAHPDELLRRLADEAQFFEALFSAGSLLELVQLGKDAARAHLVSNESFKRYFDLVSKPRERKRFDKLRIDYRELCEKSAVMSGEKAIWKTPPSATQALSWLEQLGEESGWFSARKARKAVRAALADESVDYQVALTNWLNYLDVAEQLPAMERQFAEWGIERPELELDSAVYVLRQLESEDPNELNRVAALPVSKRRELSANANRLQRFLTDCEQCLLLEPDADLCVILTTAVSAIDQLAPHIAAFSRLPENVFRLLVDAGSVAELDAIIAYSNWKLLEGRFPELARFDEKQLEQKLDTILSSENDEFGQFAQHLWWQRKVRFDEYAQLLQTPAARLKEGRKKLKVQLKSGKALLVREFGKSRQHLNIRELLQSDARPWIELLSPVWLSTPARVGDLFPMERDLFDLVVFDEASQLPLPNALGSLQRSKRALVAGDEQQMSPSAYFSGVKLSIDLLHQASWYWKKCALKHHYRSEHPQLIAFSNRHFYNNELVAYPGTSTEIPLRAHWVENGIYEDRMNQVEAKAVAAFLEKLNWKKSGASLGIVAFSEQQLNCIWNHCSPAVQAHISSGQEKGTVFFKALEQVQGDEADVLIISLGYGKDSQGNFHLRFGPLNRTDGHKRLNVLLTRAKNSLHFFSSVRASDFSISSNESVNLLRLFLTQLEQLEKTELLLLPYGITPVSREGHVLQLSGIYHTIAKAQELSTFHRVMKNRGWQIRY